MKGRGRNVVEGFRVLTLLYSLDDLPPEQRARLVELFRKYRAIASLYFWSKRLGLEEGIEQALERARKLIPYYWRKVFDDESPLYAFSELEEMARPRKQVLRLPLAEALQVKQREGQCPTTGAYIDRKARKLVLRLGDGERLELPIPKRALRWLRDKEREVEPLKVSKTVRIQWRPERAQALKVQIVLRVQRPRPAQPDPRQALLCFVDVNSRYGFAAVFASFDGERVRVHETLKLRPPNQTRRLKEAARRERAAAHGSKPKINRALARLSMKFDASGWVKRAAAEIFRKALDYAGGRPVWINIDAPDHRTVRGTRLQRTLLSIKRVAENLANWYGVFITFQCYPSRECPVCGTRAEECRTESGRARICTCRCGFEEERDRVPFYHWIRELGLPLPRPPRLPKPDREARS